MTKEEDLSALRRRLERIHGACLSTAPKQAVGEMVCAMLAMEEWTRLADRSPVQEAEAVPVATVKENPHCPEGTSDELDRYLPGRRAWEPAAFNAVATAPDHIWLDIGDDPEMREWDFSKLEGVTWSEDNATGYGVRYIRADLAPPPAASLREQEDAARYRWLRSDDIEVLPGQREIVVRLERLPFRDDQTDEVLTESALDAAIDAQRLGREKGSGE